MRTVLALCCAVLLGACAAPAVRYYQLPDSVLRPSADAPTLALTVEAEDFLNGDALVYQTSPQTLHFATQHLWVQKVDAAAANVLANALNDASATQRYLPQSGDMACPCVRVTLQRFQGMYDGTVRVAGYARFYDRDGQLNRSRYFAVDKAQHGDGYAAMVKALNDALKDVAMQIIP